MTKKWLYSVAVGTLLIAGEAMGITVHDVLSNGFWSAEQRGSYEYLDKATGHHAKRVDKKFKAGEIEEGVYTASVIWTERGPKLNDINWRGKFWYNYIMTPTTDKITSKTKLNAIRNKTHKEKTLTCEQTHTEIIETIDATYSTNSVMSSSSDYVVKPLKKDARPMGSFVVDDWFPDSMEKRWESEAKFCGTEENAITNVISDNEAYITRTVAQTGYIYNHRREPINKDASLLRVYNTHITTDADHVYVEQEITEDTQNDPYYIRKNTYQTQYTATFKKGRWKGSTETITRIGNQQMADWYSEYLKPYLRQNQTAVVSNQQPDHQSQRLKDTQNFR